MIGIPFALAHPLNLSAFYPFDNSLHTLNCHEWPVLSATGAVSLACKRWSEDTETENALPKRNTKSGGKTADIAKMNAAKAEKIRNRQAEILSVLATHDALSVSEISEKISASVSEKTIANDLRSLAGDGKVANANRKWRTTALNPPPGPVPISHNGQSI